MNKHLPETIDLSRLRQMANKKSRLRVAAQRALTEAEALNKQHRLGAIRLNRQGSCLQVYDDAGGLCYSHAVNT